MPTNTSPKKPIPKTDASKIRALEEQPAQRDAEIARLSNESQQPAKEKDQRAYAGYQFHKIRQIYGIGTRNRWTGLLGEK